MFYPKIVTHKKIVTGKVSNKFTMFHGLLAMNQDCEKKEDRISGITDQKKDLQSHIRNCIHLHRYYNL